MGIKTILCYHYMETTRAKEMPEETCILAPLHRNSSRAMSSMLPSVIRGIKNQFWFKDYRLLRFPRWGKGLSKDQKRVNFKLTFERFSFSLGLGFFNQFSICEDYVESYFEGWNFVFLFSGLIKCYETGKKGKLPAEKGACQVSSPSRQRGRWVIKL